MRHPPSWPVIDRALLNAVTGGLTSSVRARPAAKDPAPLIPPGAVAGAQAAPTVAVPAPPPPKPDPMTAMMSQLAQMG